MQILLLSIMAKCGVFTHVRDLAIYLKRYGYNPVIGFINNQNAKHLFKMSTADLNSLAKSLDGTPHFFYSSDADLMNYLNEKNIDLIHAHSPLVYQVATKIANKLNIPLVITIHGIINWSDIYMPAMNLANKIIAIGPEVAKSTGDKYKDKLQIIFNGIDIEHFKPGKISCINESLNILWIGRTNGKDARGAHHLAHAIRMIIKHDIPIQTKVLGHPIGADIRGMKFYGWVQNTLPFLQWSHIAFARGRALREAMACGNVGFLLAEGYGGKVTKDWFEGGSQVLLSGSIKHGCDMPNSTHIANDILHFHTNREDLERERKTARKIAEEYFDINKMVKETCKVYEEAKSI